MCLHSPLLKIGFNFRPKLTDCLSELMNPVYILRYKDLSRSDRVACMK